MNKKLNETSKFLSYILRHEPQSIGITLDSEGWANINTLIACAKQSGRSLTRELLQQIVDTSSKKRFSISEDSQRIRAAQGHSIKTVTIMHPEKEPPELLYHGTATQFMESIQKEGLSSGERHYVHLSGDKQTAISVGQRHGKPIVLKIEALRMYQQGSKFFQAENGVWLTEQVPAAFISI